VIFKRTHAFDVGVIDDALNRLMVKFVVKRDDYQPAYYTSQIRNYPFNSGAECVASTYDIP